VLLGSRHGREASYGGNENQRKGDDGGALRGMFAPEVLYAQSENNGLFDEAPSLFR
jgi:hypothetical protein